MRIKINIQCLIKKKKMIKPKENSHIKIVFSPFNYKRKFKMNQKLFYIIKYPKTQNTNKY